MRITTHISACGKTALSRFPTSTKTIQECCDENGHLDEMLAREALSGDHITWSGKDNVKTIAVAMEYLKQIKSSITRLETQHGDKYTSNCSTPAEKASLRKMENGKIVFARTSIKERQGDYEIKLEIGNPYDVKGNVIDHARNFSVMCARILIYMAGEFWEHNRVSMRIIEGEGCEGVLKEAVELNRRDEEESHVNKANAERMTCPNRHGDFCSPCNPSCACYRNGGKCEPLKVQDMQDCHQAA